MVWGEKMIKSELYDKALADISVQYQDIEVLSLVDTRDKVALSIEELAYKEYYAIRRGEYNLRMGL